MYLINVLKHNLLHNTEVIIRPLWVRLSVFLPLIQKIQVALSVKVGCTYVWLYLAHNFLIR